MSWIVENISKGIWKFFADMATSLIDAAFDLILKCIIELSDINKYINISKYLTYSQAIAGALLVVAVVWKGLKEQSGLGDTDRSIGIFAARVFASASAIFVLPFIVTNVMLPINNNLMLLIESLGGKFQKSNMSTLTSLKDIQNLGCVTVILLVVLGISFIILALAGAKRYIEVLVCILIAPISAVSFVNGNDGIEIWIRETVCVVFTQSVHVLLIEILIEIMKTNAGSFSYILAVGCIAVMLKGPQVLRTFLYTSGVGSATVKAAGSGTRMVAMKAIMKSSAPAA